MKMSRCDLFSVGAVVNSPLAVPNFCQAPSSPGEEPSAPPGGSQADPFLLGWGLRTPLQSSHLVTLWSRRHPGSPGTVPLAPGVQAEGDGGCRWVQAIAFAPRVDEDCRVVKTGVDGSGGWGEPGEEKDTSPPN